MFQLVDNSEKRNLTYLIFLFVINLGFCQKITINEMISKMKCQIFNCFSNFIVTKGFSYHRLSSFDDYKLYGFSSNKFTPNSSNNNIPIRNWVQFCTFENDSSSEVGISTSDINYYQALLKRMGDSGFAELSSETDDEEKIRVWYTSKSYPNLVIKVKIERLSDNNNSRTDYNLTVSLL